MISASIICVFLLDFIFLFLLYSISSFFSFFILFLFPLLVLLLELSIYLSIYLNCSSLSLPLSLSLSLKDVYTGTHQCGPTSNDLQASALFGHWIQFKGPAKRDSRSEWTVRKRGRERGGIQ